MSFICPRCKAESHHPIDEDYGYCGVCHDFTGAWRADSNTPTRALLAALGREIDMLRQLSEIERKAGQTQTTWQLLRDIATRLENAAAAADRQSGIDSSIARQLARSMQLNAKLQQRIRELQQGASNA